MFKLASWNVNSLNVRMDQVLAWLKETDMDVLALQETKLVDDNFPAQEFKDLGYQVVYSGQKTYNGVAIIAKHPLTEICNAIPGMADEQKRVMVATVNGIRLINLYVPNGADLTSDKYQYKLNWLEAVTVYIREELKKHPKLAVVGDFNIAPEDRDVHDPALWQDSVLVSPPERQAFKELLAAGLADSFRKFNQPENSFSWWDYRQGGFRRNRGLRIDHVLLSPPLLASCTASVIDINPRKSERPSDHAPVWVSLE